MHCGGKRLGQQLLLLLLLLLLLISFKPMPQSA